MPMDPETVMTRALQLGYRVRIDGSTWEIHMHNDVTLQLTFEEAELKIVEHLRFSWRAARSAERMADILADPTHSDHAAVQAWAQGPRQEVAGFNLLFDSPHHPLKFRFPTEWTDAVMDQMCRPCPFCSLHDALDYELAKREREQLELLLATAPTLNVERARL